MSERENELFEEWWENEGQYHRAGGGDYEKTFAYHAWVAVANRQGYKLVPVDTLEECLNWAACASSESWSDEQRDEIDKHYKVIEKSMIGAVE